MQKKAQLAQENSISDSLLANKTYGLRPQKTLKRLTKLQSELLREFVYYGGKALFLSLHDLGRIMPCNIQRIEQSVTYLRNSGFIKAIEANGIIHYCPSQQLKSLRKRISEITIRDGIEDKIVNAVQESLKQLYPGVLIIDSRALAVSRERRRFDIILEFRSPVMNKQFMVVDVYTAISVTGRIVQSFVKKIRETRNETYSDVSKTEEAGYPLRQKSLGMMVCNKASQKAFGTAKECDVSLIRLKDFHIDYNQLTENCF